MIPPPGIAVWPTMLDMLTITTPPDCSFTGISNFRLGPQHIYVKDFAIVCFRDLRGQSGLVTPGVVESNVQSTKLMNCCTNQLFVLFNICHISLLETSLATECSWVTLSLHKFSKIYPCTTNVSATPDALGCRIRTTGLR